MVGPIDTVSPLTSPDISWGTKGQTGANKDLGSAKQGKDGAVEVALPANSEDVDQLVRAR